MGLAKPGKPSELTGTSPGLASRESAGWVLGQVWNRTNQFLQFKPGPLAGYLDPLPALLVGLPFQSRSFVVPL